MSDLIITPAGIANLLKVVYGGVVPQQINDSIGALHSKLMKTTSDIVQGEKVVKNAPFGLHGGVGAFLDDGDLPVTSAQRSIVFTSYLKNLAGRVKFNDKAVQIAKSDRQAFENLVKRQMDALRHNCTYDYGRQLYMDGTGNLTVCGTTTAATTVVVVSTQYLQAGMVISIVATATGLPVTNGAYRKIKSVLGATTILLEGTAVVTTSDDHHIVNQNAVGAELTGVAAVMGQSGTIYGLNRSDYAELVAKSYSTVGEIDDTQIVKAIVERNTACGADIDLLVAHPDVWTAYGAYLAETRQNVNTQTLEGGWKALTVGGTPLTMDRFVPKQTLYGFETKNWTEHQLHDWEFKGEEYMRLDSSLNFETVLAKYAEIVCDKPAANFVMAGITVT